METKCKDCCHLNKETMRCKINGFVSDAFNVMVACADYKKRGDKELCIDTKFL